MFLELGEGGGTREERGGTREVMSLSLSLSLSSLIPAIFLSVLS